MTARFVTYLRTIACLAAVGAAAVGAAALFGSITALPANAQAQTASTPNVAPSGIPPIIPTPQQWTWQDGEANLSEIRTIMLSGVACSEERQGAELLLQALEKRGGEDVSIQCGPKDPNALSNAEPGAAAGSLPIIIGPPSAPHVTAHAPDFKLPDGKESEGYVLTVTDEAIVIAAPEARGRFYGAMSLLQMIQASDRALPHISITDYPALVMRGVSDDFSRGQVSTMENFRKIIRFLARHKMNTYMPYMEDVIELAAYPSIGEGRGALSKDEIRELQDYAARYYVEIIPIFQTLGHYENILNMDRFVRYAEYPGAASLNTQSDAAFEFLTTMLEEVIPLFDSQYFHIGADESWDVGRGASREAVERIGGAAVHADWYRRVYEFVGRYDKQVLMYSDRMLRYPDILDQIPDDIIVVDWHYGANLDYPSVEVLEEDGQPFVVSPGVRNWNHIFPDHAAAWANIYNLTVDGQRHGARGAITSNWGDYGAPNFRELNYRGYAYAAETSWNPAGGRHRAAVESADADPGIQVTRTDRRFNRDFYGASPAALQGAVDLLVRLGQDVSFPQIWRHPFNVIESSGWGLLGRVKTLQQNSATARELLASVRDELPRRSEHLDYHDFAARLIGWHAELLEFALRYREMNEALRAEAEGDGGALARPEDVAGPTHDLSERANNLSDRPAELRDELDALAEDYRNLWLRTNRPANLHRVTELFAYQDAYLQEMRAGIRDGSYAVPATLGSDFIAAPGALQEPRDGSAASGIADDTPTAQRIPPASVSFVRKTFTLPAGKQLERAYLQLLGDSKAEVWLGGDSIGGVMSTRSLSLWAENQRVRYWDVTNRLERGSDEATDHVIAARAASYREERPAAANVLLQLHYDDGTTEQIRSDSTWRATTDPFHTSNRDDRSDRDRDGVRSGGDVTRPAVPAWTRLSYDASEWSRAVTTSFPRRVSPPLFEYGLPSRIEF